MLFGRNRNLVGLDIGDSSIKVVELKDLGKGRGYQVVKLGWEPLSSEAIVDGAILDSQLVIETIQRLFQRLRIRNPQVATALYGHSVIVKRISLPTMSEAELAESIHWEAEQYIPFAIEDVNLDYQVLEGSSLSGEGNLDVLLAAAKKDKINDYVSVITQAGLTPTAVDIASFALQGAFEANYEFEPHQVIALVDIGAAVTSITVLHGGTSVYWRDINIGGNQYTDSIQKELNLSAEQAEQLKRGEELEGITFERVLPILSSVNNDIAAEVQKTLDFFKQISTADEPLDRLYLTGGATQVVHLKEALAERLGTQVEIQNPFRKMPPAGRDVTPEQINQMLPTASVAVGLALRRVGDGKINLLAERKPAKAKASAGLKLEGVGGTQNLLLAGILIIGFLFAGGWWWVRSAELRAWKTKKAAAEAELVRLKEILKKNEEFKKQKEVLEHKINLITDLKKKQDVPVHVLDQISKNLPDFLWLDSLSATQNQITVTGKATNFNAVSNFYNNLARSGYFSDVVLGRTAEVAEGVAFSLNCKFVTPKEPAQAATQG
jgi:type IV pilus assembly protein PilM